MLPSEWPEEAHEEVTGTLHRLADLLGSIWYTLSVPDLADPGHTDGATLVRTPRHPRGFQEALSVAGTMIWPGPTLSERGIQATWPVPAWPYERLLSCAAAHDYLP